MQAVWTPPFCVPLFVWCLLLDAPHPVWTGPNFGVCILVSFLACELFQQKLCFGKKPHVSSASFTGKLRSFEGDLAQYCVKSACAGRTWMWTLGWMLILNWCCIHWYLHRTRPEWSAPSLSSSQPTNSTQAVCRNKYPGKISLNHSETNQDELPKDFSVILYCLRGGYFLLIFVSEASIRVKSHPTFHQTWWQYLSCAFQFLVPQRIHAIRQFYFVLSATVIRTGGTATKVKK